MGGMRSQGCACSKDAPCLFLDAYTMADGWRAKGGPPVTLGPQVYCQEFLCWLLYNKDRVSMGPRAHNEQGALGVHRKCRHKAEDWSQCQADGRTALRRKGGECWQIAHGTFAGTAASQGACRMGAHRRLSHGCTQAGCLTEQALRSFSPDLMYEVSWQLTKLKLAFKALACTCKRCAHSSVWCAWVRARACACVCECLCLHRKIFREWCFIATACLCIACICAW